MSVEDHKGKYIRN